MKKTYRILALGAFFIVAVLFWLSYPSTGVSILAYHRVMDDNDRYSVSPADFEEEMRYLAKNGYTAISLANFFAAREGQASLPRKPVIITFDDGYDDNLLTALPILEKYGMKATVFVISSSVGQPNYLSWEQIGEMAKRSTEIGSHTHTHVALTQLSIADREREVQVSKAMLEEHLGKPVKFLAYPYGEYDAAMSDVLKNAGYRGACSGVAGLNFAADNAYMLKRINVPRPKHGLWEFRLRLLRANICAKLGS